MSLATFVARVGQLPSWLADQAHIWFAAWVVLAATHLFGHEPYWIGGVVVAAMLKEFVFDIKVEKDSWTGSLIDFAGYCFGCAISVAILR